jgi:CsoR family transcriptional regulator, copper-sensing transcriptional repressor
MRGYEEHKDDVLGRLGKVEGQVRGLQRMVRGDAYCIDILTQVSAATRALKKVAVGLLDDHIRHCMAEGNRDGRVSEASEAIDRLLRA